jgi:thiamine kinase-like enzyme
LKVLDEPADPAEIAGRVPGWNGRARVIGPLAGGTTNRNYAVEVDGDRYVVRLPGENTALLDIDRNVERAANDRAATLGFAPEVIALVEPDGCLVTRFIVGDAIAKSALAEPDTLARVATILRTLHESGPFPGTFDAFTVVARHHDAARSRGVSIPSAYERVSAIVGEISAAFGVTAEPSCLCHNDLLAANFLRTPARIWLLDWEYAGMNDRYFDLGNLAVNNEMDEGAETQLITEYFGGVTRRRRARLRLMKMVSDAREAMWGVVQQGIATIDFDYAGYAGEHFDRLLRNAGAPGYRALLDDAATPEGDAQ